MPNVTVYIRKADIEKWNSIPNKSRFLQKALGGTSVESPTKPNKVSISDLKKIPGITTADELEVKYEPFE